MSLTNMLLSEKILVATNKPYRQAIKIQLKALIAEGNLQAQNQYEELFPKWKISQKPEEDQYTAKIINRKKEKIPHLFCKTCGKSSDRVIEFDDFASLKREKRKTWRRIIKRNLNYKLIIGSRTNLRNRRIFFAYNMIQCIEKRHKLQVRYLKPHTMKQMGFAYKA